MGLYCFTNFSHLPICVKFFNEDRQEEYFLPSEVGVIRNDYGIEYEILSIVIEEDFILLTIYKPNDYKPM